jgi:alpha-glucosidase
MKIDDTWIGHQPKITKKITNTISEIIYPEVPEKNAQIPDEYNEMELHLKGKAVICFRAYNNGFAWRFGINLKSDVVVQVENMNLNFPAESKVWFPEEEQFFSHNERNYLIEKVTDISTDRFCSLPALIESTNEIKILVTETDLQDYPGMWLQGTGENSLKVIFPGVALEEDQTSDRDVKVTQYADYLAETNGSRTFPWRIMAVAKNDADLITNQLSYILVQPCAIDDPSWIKPGKVAWDWWNNWNIYGVDFEAGVNTETYKYYIDFASKYGIEYIILDEGWYELGNLLKVVPEIDMEEIIRYSSEKNVGVILWVVWKTLYDQWDDAFDQFENWGVKGLKVDFMQRDDQWMVNYYWKVAEEAAKRKMVIDFHGAYKPAGLRRTYPNVLTREGVRGLEHSKWGDRCTPEHNVTLPFIRMVAGPMDYTPGAMKNATEKNFKPIYSAPMSMGTRCHQLAMYVVFESPLQMLCDNPSNYLNEPECMEFLSAVPTVWDTTIVLSAKVGDQIAIARKHGEEWYIGAMTNWDPRSVEIDFSFLGDGQYSMEVYEDGNNAHRHAADYKKVTTSITSEEKMAILLAPGGGWAARIIPQ